MGDAAPRGSTVLPPIPSSWRMALADVVADPSYRELEQFVDRERKSATVYPPPHEVFRALELTPLRHLSVLVLGQDPYAGPGQANGLAFSVRVGVTPPPSLRNIFRELHVDLGCERPAHGSLVSWARQGVLLLNAVLTVREGRPNSHRNRGWERFTDAVIERVNAKRNRVVFVLWGRHAQRKASLIDETRHTIVQGPHPSPLSAKRGFFGSRPFSTANRALREAARRPIDWCQPAATEP